MRKSSMVAGLCKDISMVDSKIRTRSDMVSLVGIFVVPPLAGIRWELYEKKSLLHPWVWRMISALNINDGSIYWKFFCNITATGAPSGDQGRFADDHPSLISPNLIGPAWDNTTNQNYHLLSAGLGSKWHEHLWTVAHGSSKSACLLLAFCILGQSTSFGNAESSTHGRVDLIEYRWWM